MIKKKDFSDPSFPEEGLKERPLPSLHPVPMTPADCSDEDSNISNISML